MNIETVETHHNWEALLNLLWYAELQTFRGIDIDGVSAELCAEPAEGGHGGGEPHLAVSGSGSTGWGQGIRNTAEAHTHKFRIDTFNNSRKRIMED